MTVLDYRSGLEELSDPTRGRAGSWLSWAVYLGMSWTWCIGMFLPVLLVRDYGIWAWFIFAIPNVVGAAAMGWVLKEHDSQTIVVAHARAVRGFSLITAAYQIFFALWMFHKYETRNAVWVCLVFALVVLRASRRDQDAHGIASVVFMGSLVTMLFLAMQGALHLPPAVPMKVGTVLNLCALAPVCALGFLLCPYLDSTFHLARQRLHESQARAAFSTGFGVFFFLMILYSLLYAGLLMGANVRDVRAGVIGHWVIQLGFTIGVHWYGLPRLVQTEDWTSKWIRIGLTLALGGAAWSLTVLDSNALDGEIIYRSFLGFYGLLFPAYVWLCMLPGHGRLPPSHRQFVVLGITVVVALPMYWLGFVEGKMLWLLPGVAIVLLARLLIKPGDLSPEPVAIEASDQ